MDPAGAFLMKVVYNIDCFNSRKIAPAGSKDL